MKKKLKKSGIRLSNLLFYIIEHNKFLTDQFPFLLDHLESYEKTSHIKVKEPTNLFDINLFVGKERQIVECIRRNLAIFKIPPVVNVNARSYIHNIGEGYTDAEFFLMIHELIDLLGLKGPVIFSNSSMNCDKLYEKFLREFKLQKKFDVQLSLRDFESKGLVIDGVTIYEKFEEIVYNKDSLHEKKLFCNFNMRARHHRSAMIALLNYYDLLENNYISTPTKTFRNVPPNVEKDWKYLLEDSKIFLQRRSDLDLIVDKLSILKNRYPLRIDDRSEDETDAESLLNPLIHRARVDSLFELVSETLVSESIFFTEKIFIPVVLCKPFLLIASFESLKTFKNFGYQTFHPYINEEYDTIEDDAERCVAICKELQRLQELRNKNPEIFYHNFMMMIEICKKNKQVFFKEK
jgi:hypothetical protein